MALRMREEIKDHPESLLNELSGNDPEKLDMILLEKAFRAGDAYAVKLWEEMSLRHAQAFGLFIQSFNPQRLVLGTLAWAIGDIYIDPIKAQLSKFCWKEPMEACEIVCSELRRDIASYAGIAAALNYLNERSL